VINLTLVSHIKYDCHTCTIMWEKYNIISNFHHFCYNNPEWYVIMHVCARYDSLKWAKKKSSYYYKMSWSQMMNSAMFYWVSWTIDNKIAIDLESTLAVTSLVWMQHLFVSTFCMLIQSCIKMAPNKIRYICSTQGHSFKGTQLTCRCWEEFIHLTKQFLHNFAFVFVHFLTGNDFQQFICSQTLHISILFKWYLSFYLKQQYTLTSKLRKIILQRSNKISFDFKWYFFIFMC
jgi:hypothetical protein